MSALTDRLIRAAAEAFIKAHRYDEADPPGKVDDYARFLYLI